MSRCLASLPGLDQVINSVTVPLIDDRNFHAQFYFCFVKIKFKTTRLTVLGRLQSGLNLILE